LKVFIKNGSSAFRGPLLMTARGRKRKGEGQTYKFRNLLHSLWDPGPHTSAEKKGGHRSHRKGGRAEKTGGGGRGKRETLFNVLFNHFGQSLKRQGARHRRKFKKRCNEQFEQCVSQKKRKRKKKSKCDEKGKRNHTGTGGR